jgi:hypothetical protein
MGERIMKAVRPIIKTQPPLPIPGVKPVATRFKHVLTEGLLLALVAHIDEKHVLCRVVDPGQGGLLQNQEYRFLKSYLREVD